MKISFKMLPVLATMLMAGSVFAADVTKEFTVTGWSCGSCAGKTVAAIKKLDGVKDAKADAEKGMLTVTFDDAKIKHDKIQESIKASGYGCSLKDKQG